MGRQCEEGEGKGDEKETDRGRELKGERENRKRVEYEGWREWDRIKRGKMVVNKRGDRKEEGRRLMG